MVPVHWMGNNRVQMVMVRKSSAQNLHKGGSEPFRPKGKKAQAEAKKADKEAWKRLARQGEKFASRMEDMTDMPPPDTDPQYNAETRSKMLNSLNPPNLQRLQRREHEQTRAAQGLPNFSAHNTSEPPQLSRQPSAATALIKAVKDKVEKNRDQTMCPFSGEMVPPHALVGHMEEWRALMRAELTSLKLDELHGPRVGLFTIPEMPEEKTIPSAGMRRAFVHKTHSVQPELANTDASAIDIEEWNESALEKFKEGYVKTKPDGKKHHWAEYVPLLALFPSTPQFLTTPPHPCPLPQAEEDA